jgi:SAM-dependent methyltransferase
MGIDIHALNFLRYTRKKKLFADTITIGRQALNVRERVVKALMSTGPSYKPHAYCEDILLEYFGATKVDSVDNSDFEAATHIHDMNEPLPHSLCEKFDTVFDGGCLEHVFNAPQALKNCSLLCKPGGQIIHVLPANNLCGHGFWQFSPELFFSLYSKTNGYSETEVFLADLSDTHRWFRVDQPTNGRRVNVSSSTALYVLVRTVLQNTRFSHSNVQQSDYIFEWEKTKSFESTPRTPPTSFRDRLKQIPLIYDWLSPAYRLYLRSMRSNRETTRLSDRNPGLTMIHIDTCV